MTHCEYEEIVGEDADSEGYRYVRCTHCGEVVRSNFTVEKLTEATSYRPCPSPSDRIPLKPTKNIFQMGISYLASYIRHMSNGRPQCTAPQILDRYANGCSKCECYNPPTGQCGLCACYVAPTLVPAYANKLAWADEECPKIPQVWPRLDKPKATPQEDKPPSDKTTINE